MDNESSKTLVLLDFSCKVNESCALGTYGKLLLTRFRPAFKELPMLKVAPVFASVGSELLITKVREPSGWLSNMSPHPVSYGGKRWRTCEALFQALRLKDEDAKEVIRKESSPMAAKMVAKRFRGIQVVEPMSKADLANMRLCIWLKLDQHGLLRRKLFRTGQSKIIEDCSSRGARGSNLFWGAMRVPEGWQGENWLGRIWEEMRVELQVAAR